MRGGSDAISLRCSCGGGLRVTQPLEREFVASKPLTVGAVASKPLHLFLYVVFSLCYADTSLLPFIVTGNNWFVFHLTLAKTPLAHGKWRGLYGGR